MIAIDRRGLIKGVGAASALAVSGVTNVTYAQTAAPRVVIIGGGAGGATAATYLLRQAPNVNVTLIEPDQKYVSCFFSNLFIGGFRTIESITHSYAEHKRQGINVVHDLAVDVDTAKKTVTLISGSRLPYDRLVLSPGFDFKYDAIEGYSREVSQTMPHAWRAGPQSVLLKSQIEAMPERGVVVLAAPPDPYSCPPGPYERACMIAHLLKTKKPGAKLIVFDPKTTFSKQAVFVEAFQKHYSGIVEFNLTTEIDDFTVVSVDPATKTVVTKGGIKVKADVVNIIPAQRAGGIAKRAGCVEGDWCPIVPETFASAKVPDIYIIGDAAVASDMPKSGFSANNQGKLVANVLASELGSKELFPQRLRNTCWSLVAPNDCIKIGANYSVGEREGKKRLIAFDGFVSEPGEGDGERRENFEESVGWYSAITSDMFGAA